MLKRLRTVLAAIGILAALVIIALPTPEGLTRPGQNSLSIFVLCLSLWVTNVLASAITGLLAVALLGLLVFEDAAEAFALFGNRAVFFILCVFIMSAAMIASGLSRRLALIFLRAFDRSPRRLVFGVFFTSAFFSLWMPEHAVAAMLLPLILDIAGELKLVPRESRYGATLFLAMAWGSVIGGVGTLLGGARAPLALSLLKADYGRSISFAEWMAAGLPVAAFVFVVGYLVIGWLFPPDVGSVRAARNAIADDFRGLSRLSSSERKVAVIVGLTLGCWIVLGHRVDLAVIAMLAAVSLFVVRAVEWDEIREYINWRILLMYGGAVALGVGVERTGAIEWAVKALPLSREIPPAAFVGVTAVLTMGLTAAISNAACVAVLLPIAFSVGDQIGLCPVITTFAVAIPAGLDFCLPIGTPAMAMAFSSGYVSLRDTLRVGPVLGAIGLAAVLLAYLLVWRPLAGP